jgi:hypothetical protein
MTSCRPTAGDGGRLVAVVGATGGCGTTTIALHLALSIARSTSTCFLEVASEAGAAERMGLDRARLRTWANAADPDDLRLSALPMSAGFRAAFAPSSEMLAPATAVRFGDLFDSVILDAPVDYPLVADLVTVLVVAATLPAAHRAARVVGSTDAVILNRTGAGGSATRLRLERALGASVGIELPHCPGMRAAEDEGRLLREGTLWSRRLRRLAMSIANEVVS